MTDPTWRIIVGDALTSLRELPNESVQTCITSPPYFGLRDYGTAKWEGGAPECEHEPRAASRSTRAAGGLTGGKATVDAGTVQRDCHCGARRVDSQIGLEPTPDEFVAALVGVFREVRRVLRDDGTLWLNLGDSYATAQSSDNRSADERAKSSTLGPKRDGLGGDNAGHRSVSFTPRPRHHGVKTKDLLGIPWMVAFALRADGWYLRSDIIWAKPNPMPESVTDRPTKAHEYLFLLAKGPRYFYDAEAIREDNAESSLADLARRGQISKSAGNGETACGYGGASRVAQIGNGRNRRSVWTVATHPYAGAHFATFPPKLIEPCVLAGSSHQGCGECGAPWQPKVERTPMVVTPSERVQTRDPAESRTATSGTMTQAPTSQVVGWQPTCDHGDGSGRCVVLDPFAGAGTTGLVALRRGRSFIGCELNPTYAEMARERIRQDAPLFNVAAECA